MSDSKLSVRILTEYFHPEEASTAQLMTELATGLAGEFEVSVVTAMPNYHEDDRSADIDSRSRHRGVDISRLRSTRFDKDSIPLRVINWITFTGLTLLHLLRRGGDDDALVVLSNPPVLPFAAWAHKRIRGTPYAYVIYDMYPDMPIGLGVLAEDGIVARLWERAIRMVYRDADRIVVLGESMERRLDRKMADDPGFDSGKIEIIPNWEDGEFLQPVEKTENEFAREQGTTDAFTLLYSGNIGRYHDVGTAIDAIEILEQRGREDIQLLVIGEGGRKPGYQQRVADRDIEHVRFLPFQPLEKLPETLTCGDASLVAIDEVMEGICVSSKLYSSLAVGDPVLAVVADGDEVARVVREHDCGAHARPGEPESVADILERWADDPELTDRLGENARACFEENYRKEHAVTAYADVLRSLSAEG
jgi:glycosyltransferase involved in cell wall biosynthesis